jgi:hypothetical protein
MTIPPNRPATRIRPIAEQIEQRVLYAADPIGVSEVLVVNDANVTQNENSFAELVVIDTRVEDYQTLITDLQAQQANGRNLEILLVTPNEDAIALISAALAQGNQPFSAIHLISHGSDGSLEIGANGLSNTVIEQQASPLAQWSQYLSQDADIRLYGCDFAQSAAGKQAINSLASLTGADIAASADVTGHSSLYGNWQLEVSTGAQEVANAISASAEQQWRHTLEALIAPSTTVSVADVTNLAQGQTNTTYRLAVNDDGVTLVGLIEENPITGANRLHLQFTPAGANPVLFSRFPVTGVTYPSPGLNLLAQPLQVSVATLDNGDFAVAWVSSTPYENQFTIAYAVYSDRGDLQYSGNLNRNVQSVSHINISGDSKSKFAVNYLSTTLSSTDGLPNEINLLVKDGSNDAINYSYVESSATLDASHADYIQNDTFVVAATSHNAIEYSIIGYSFDISKLDQDIDTGRLKTFATSIDAITSFNIHSGHDAVKPIYTPQVISTENDNFIALWTERWDFGLGGGSFVNIAGIALTVDASGQIIQVASGQLNQTNLIDIESARSYWDSTSRQLVMAYTTASGIEMHLLEDDLDFITGTKTTVTAPPGQSLMTVGVHMNDQKGQVLYQVMPLGVIGPPAPANPLAFAKFDYNVHSLTVDTDADSDDGDTSSIAALLANRGSDNAISLREAIKATNNTANSSTGIIDKINFASELRIRLSGDLPEITEALQINGSPVVGSNNVVIDGDGAANYGLRFANTAANSLVDNLVFGNFRNDGVFSKADQLTVRNSRFGYVLRNDVYEEMRIGQNGINIQNSNNVSLNGNSIGNSNRGIVFNQVNNSSILNSSLGDISELNGQQTGFNRDAILMTNVSVGNEVIGNNIAKAGYLNTGALSGIAGSGIRLTGFGTNFNVIYGNSINNNGFDGITIEDLASANTIGKADSNAPYYRNTIFSNGYNGVLIWSRLSNQLEFNLATRQNRVLINSIFGNGLTDPTTPRRAVELALVDLSLPETSQQWGTTQQQDALDADVGTNDLINSLDNVDPTDTAPTWRAVQQPNGLHLTGNYHGESNATVRIDFYAYIATSTSPEMTVWLGATEVTLNSLGVGAFDLLLPDANVSVSAQKITAGVTKILSGTGATASFGSSSRTSLGINIEPQAYLNVTAVTPAIEDQAIGLGPVVNVSNPDAPTEVLILLIEPTAGRFSVNDSALTVARSIVGTASQINTALQSLTFKTEDNFNGPFSIKFSLSNQARVVQDQGIATFNIAAVNDAPIITASPQAVAQNAGLTLRPDMFVVTDDSTPVAIQSYRLSSAPNFGQLLRNGVVLGINDEITAAEMSSGEIVYVNTSISTIQADQFGLYVIDAEGLASVNPTIFNLTITLSSTGNPQFTNISNTAIVTENLPWSTYFYTTTEIINGAVTVALSGADASLFTLAAVPSVANDKWVLTLKNPANFEVKTSYSINIVATDSLGRITSLPFVLNIANQDEAPYITVTYPLVAGTVFEDQAFNLQDSFGVPTVVVYEPDNVSDLDGGATYLVTAYLSVTNAWLQMPVDGPGALAGVTVQATSAYGATSVQIFGEARDVNAFLSSVTITGNPNSSQTVQFSLSVEPSNLPNPTKNPIFFDVPLTALNDVPTLADFSFSAILGTVTPLVIDRALIADIEQSNLSDNNFSFVLTQAPTQGKLIRNGGGVVLLNEQITYADILAGNILFKPNQLALETDLFKLTIYDASGASGNTANVTINLKPTTAANTVITINSRTAVAENTVATFNFSYAIDAAVTSYSMNLIGPDAARFRLTDLGNGQAQISFIAPADFDQPGAANGSNQFEGKIAITDSFGRTVDAQFFIDITDVNENAILTGFANLVANEDSAIALGSAKQQITLVDPDKIESVQQLTLNLTNAWFDPAPLNGLSVTQLASNAQGATQIAVAGTAAQLQSLLTRLVLQPNQNFNGTAAMQVTVQDLAAGASANNATIQLDFTINAVNDKPVLAITATSLAESASLTLNASLFTATDIDSNVSTISYEVVTLPSLGTISLNGQVLTSGQRFTQAQLNAGQVVYQHSAAGAGDEVMQIAAIDDAGARSNPTSLAIKVNRVVAPVITVTPPITISTAPPATALPPVNTVAPTSTANPVAAGAVTQSNVAASIPQTNSAAVRQEAGRAANTTQTDLAAASNSTPQAPANVGFAPVSNNSNRIASDAAQGNQERALDRFAPASALATSRTGSLNSPALQAQVFKLQESMKSVGFQQELKQMRDEVNQSIQLEKTVVTSTVAVSTGVSIGYVIWLLRGGVLISSLMASLPAWRSFDPLPILANSGRRDEPSDDDSLENLLKKARRKIGLDADDKKDLPVTPKEENAIAS